MNTLAALSVLIAVAPSITALKTNFSLIGPGFCRGTDSENGTAPLAIPQCVANEQECQISCTERVCDAYSFCGNSNSKKCTDWCADGLCTDYMHNNWEWNKLYNGSSRRFCSEGKFRCVTYYGFVANAVNGSAAVNSTATVDATECYAAKYPPESMSSSSNPKFTKTETRTTRYSAAGFWVSVGLQVGLLIYTCIMDLREHKKNYFRTWGFIVAVLSAGSLLFLFWLTYTSFIGADLYLWEAHTEDGLVQALSSSEPTEGCYFFQATKWATYCQDWTFNSTNCAAKNHSTYDNPRTDSCQYACTLASGKYAEDALQPNLNMLDMTLNAGGYFANNVFARGWVSFYFAFGNLMYVIGTLYLQKEQEWKEKRSGELDIQQRLMWWLLFVSLEGFIIAVTIFVTNVGIPQQCMAVLNYEDGQDDLAAMVQVADDYDRHKNVFIIAPCLFAGFLVAIWLYAKCAVKTEEKKEECANSILNFKKIGILIWAVLTLIVFWEGLLSDTNEAMGSGYSMTLLVYAAGIGAMIIDFIASVLEVREPYEFCGGKREEKSEEKSEAGGENANPTIEM